MNDEEAVDLLNQLETTERLFELKLGDWCIWPLFKMEVMMMLTGLSVSGKGNPPGRVWRIRSGFADILTLTASPKRDFVIKTGTATLLDRAGAKYKDFLFDDLAGALDNVHKIETVIDASHLRRRKQSLMPATIGTSGAELAGGLAWRLSKDARYDALAGRISSVLQQKLALEACTPTWASARIRHFDAMRRVYRVILGKLARRALLVGDPGEFGAVAAARELGLASVELQHGLLNSHHPAYAWSRAPSGAWPSLPVADRLFAFGKYWKDTLSEIPFWENRVDVTGSLRMDAYRKSAGSTRDARRLILFTTQGIDVDAAIGFVRDARAQQAAAERTHLVVKLHPAWDTSKERYSQAFAGDGGVEVQLASEGETTLEMLTHASLHISISSFCHYEACALGVPTCVLPFATSDSMRPMIAAGHATLASTPRELARAFDGGNGSTVRSVASAYYFEPGALGHMVGALRRLTA